MDDQGIAWMIAGGRRETPDQRRMRMHRMTLAESAAARPVRWSSLRERLAAAMTSPTVEPRDPRAPALDCCPA